MTEPTDAELDTIDMEAQAVANQNPIGTLFAWRKAYLAAFASAVLTKWGTPPAVSGEPVGEFDQMRGRLVILAGAPMFKHRQKVYTTPQPTQAQAGAVPLTDEQLWANDEIMSLNADLGWHMDTIRMFTRVIERAHGIKGGQHGADT